MHATSRLAVAFRAVTIAAVGPLAIAPLTTVPAAAKTCKDIITAHARSSAQVSDETREKPCPGQGHLELGQAGRRHLRLGLPLLVSRGGTEGRVQGHREVPELLGRRQAVHGILSY